MIDLHYWPTPNGKKVTILFEELGIEYRVVPCAIGRGDQFRPDFLEISPNNRMPAIVDHSPADGGGPLSVFESGAIMMYVADKEGRFFPVDLRSRWEVSQWVMWQMANQGPKTGEAGHFRRLKDREGDQSYAVRRFTDEVHRCCGVMNHRLYDRRYLAGDAYTIADMICYPWTAALERYDGVDLGEFVYLERWLDELGAREGVRRGMAVGEDLADQLPPISDEEKERLGRLLYNQRARPAPEGGLL